MTTTIPFRSNRWIVVLFLAALWTPFLGMFVSSSEIAKGYEDHAAFTWRRDAVTAYVRNHFGFRGPLITAQALVKVRVFGISTSSDVILGADGWLFYTVGGTIEASQGRYRFTEDQLDAWLNWMGDNTKWMRDRSIASAFVVPPDKSTIYPELLPDRWYGGPSRLDQLEHGLAARPEVRYVSLRGPMEQAKERGPLFHRTDSHWNAAGAYAAYRVIVPSIAGSDVPLISYADHLVGTDVFVGDLVRLLGLSSVWKERYERLRPVAEIAQSSGLNARKVILFGDSFAISLEELLARHFRVIRVKTPVIDRALIEREHPDFVLVEVIERALNTHPPEGM